MPTQPRPRFSARCNAKLRVIAPGLLVAATGVGAGDLATAAFTGNRLGVTILWAVLLGAFLKFALNEGLARWQLATGETLLEGSVKRLGRGFTYPFLGYLLFWSFFVGSALMSACGVAFHALIPVFEDPVNGKIVFGIAASAIGFVCVKLGGYATFERTMALLIAGMFLTVIPTAFLLAGDGLALLEGTFVPRIRHAEGEGLPWTVALMGGVGGTLTVLCYGYWIREQGRDSGAHLKTCRIDLAVAYSATALFGIAMVIMGNESEVTGRGATLITRMAERLEGSLGVAGRYVFLLGACSAVFSSLLGVWQAVPYIFADFCANLRRDGHTDAADRKPLRRTRTYQWYLVALATIPALGLSGDFEEVQKIYAIFGALFIPFLAVLLLILNGKTRHIGNRHRNRPITTAVLIATLLAFGVYGVFQIEKLL